MRSRASSVLETITGERDEGWDLDIKVNYPYAWTTVPQSWGSGLPDWSVERWLKTIHGAAYASPALLHGGYPDLAVVVWAQLHMWLHYDNQGGEVSWLDLAEALGFDLEDVRTVARQLHTAIQPLLGLWLHRKWVRPGVHAYWVVSRHHNRQCGLIRAVDVGLLNAAGPHADVRPRDLVDFARWQLECGPRGWTAEPASVIADRWGVAGVTVRASRNRLSDLGFLTVEPRGPGRAPIVWLKEVYDPVWQPAPRDREIQPPSDLWLECQPRATVARRRSALVRSVLDKTRLASTDSVAGCVADDTSQMLPGRLPAAETGDALVPSSDMLGPIVPSAARVALAVMDGAEVANTACANPAGAARVEPDEWLQECGAATDIDVLDHLRRVRSGRRRTAIALLISPRRDPEARETRRPHEVYLLHFPEEHRFKVGLSRVDGGRVEMFHRHGAIEVSRITVANRRMAELVEVDVLSAVERWHQLGDRHRPGGGYTEMWSDDGPTVDLASFVAAAEALVTRVRNLCEGS